MKLPTANFASHLTASLGHFQFGSWQERGAHPDLVWTSQSPLSGSEAAHTSLMLMAVYTPEQNVALGREEGGVAVSTVLSTQDCGWHFQSHHQLQYVFFYFILIV